MRKKTLTILDGRTGSSLDVQVVDGAIQVADLHALLRLEGEGDLVIYDPALSATATCKSAISYVDRSGTLLYRGYPVEQLAERACFLDVAFLLVTGELPEPQQRSQWRRAAATGLHLPPEVAMIVERFPHDAPPMAMLTAAVASLSSFPHGPDESPSPEGKRRATVPAGISISDAARLLGASASIAARIRRHIEGGGEVPPEPDLGYVENLLYMSVGPGVLPPHDVTRALETLLLLHADLGQNCSATVMRAIGSAGADLCASAAGAVAALSGPLHGGASEQVLRMLEETRTPEKVPMLLRDVREGRRLLMGFGHRIFRTVDPRTVVLRRLAAGIRDAAPLYAVALELERLVAEDPSFAQKGIYPNVDLYSGMIERAAGFPPSMFPVLFAVGRMAGWIAQWNEMRNDPDQRIVWPRQVYTGPVRRDLPQHFHSAQPGP